MTKALREFLFFLVRISVCAALAACSTAPQPPPTIDANRVWPAPPYQPVLKFLGVFSSENNFAEGPCDPGSGQFEKLKYPISSWPMGGDKVVVVEKTPPEIKVIDFPQRKVYPLFEQEPPFSEPVDLVGDRNDNLYIADRKQQQILVFSASLKPLRTIGAAFELKALEKLALDDKAGVLYLTDSFRNEGFAFDLQGTLLFRFGAGLLAEPHGLAIHPNGNLYVADTGNAKIRIFNSKGEYLEDFPIGQQRFPSPLKKPWDLAFDSQGILQIIDPELDFLLTCRDDGEILFATGTSKRKDNHLLGFYHPTDIHVDPSGQVFIADRNNFRLSVWQLITNAPPAGFFARFGRNFALSCQEYEQRKAADQTAKRPSIFKVGKGKNVIAELLAEKGLENTRDTYKEVLCLGSVKCKSCMSFNNISVDTERIEYVLAQMHREGGATDTASAPPSGESSARCRKCDKPLDLSRLLEDNKIRYCLEPREICASKP